MPQSIPGGKKQNTGDKSVRLPFWAVSLILHAALLGGLLTWGPAREVVFQRKQTERANVLRRGEPLVELIEELRDQTAEALKARVELLREGRNRMDRNFVTINEKYQPLEDSQRTLAKARLSFYVVRMSGRFEELERLLLPESPPDDIEPVLREARKLSVRSIDDAEQIKRGLFLLDGVDDGLIARQIEAEDAQYAFDRVLNNIEDSWRDLVRRRDALPGIEATASAVQKELQAFNEQALELEKAVETAKTRLQAEMAARDALRGNAEKTAELAEAENKVKAEEELVKKAQVASKAQEANVRSGVQKRLEAETALKQAKDGIDSVETRIAARWKDVRKRQVDIALQQAEVIKDIMPLIETADNEESQV